MKKFFKKTEGFTLVELIVVIAILGILAGVGTVGYSGYIKKANEAADKQLLSAAATALNVACIENNVAVKDLAGAQIVLATDGTVADTDAPLDLSGTKAYKAQPASYNMRAASPAEDFEAAINDSFTEGFSCEGVEFKLYIKVVFTKDGTFMGIAEGSAYAELLDTIIADNATAIEAVQNSAFYNIGSDALLGQVNDVAGLATTLIAGDSLLTGVVMNETYLANLADRMGISSDDLMKKLGDMEKAGDIEGMSQFLANSTVLNVAGTVNSDSFDEAAALNKFATGDWGGLGTTLNTDPETGLAEVAMLYGLYTAYDQEAASKLALTGDVAALVALKDNTAFKTYLSGLNDPTSQASKDYAGYKSALSIVDQSAANKDVANQILTNGYNDSELLALLQGVLGA